MGTQKNRLNETVLLSTQRKMFKLMDKKIIAILGWNYLTNWPYDNGMTNGQPKCNISKWGFNHKICFSIDKGNYSNTHQGLETLLALKKKKVYTFKFLQGWATMLSYDIFLTHYVCLPNIIKISVYSYGAHISFPLKSSFKGDNSNMKQGKLKMWLPATHVLACYICRQHISKGMRVMKSTRFQL